jgi:hypothetical protein
MKFPFAFLTFLILFTNCQNSSKQTLTNRADAKNSFPHDYTNREILLSPEILPDSVQLLKFELSDTLHFDFNCDDEIDEAFFRKSDKGIALIIKDSRNSKEIKIGEDPTFQLTGDTFEWVDTWGATSDTLTYEVLLKDGEISGSKNVVLDCFSIVLRRQDEGGGIITFKNGTYQWIHQAD